MTRARRIGKTALFARTLVLRRGRAVATNAVAVAAETRLDPAELVNSAIDALIQERCEPPSLSTLLRVAGNAHRRINSTQWQQVHERLSELDAQRLDEMLNPVTPNRNRRAREF